MLIAYIKSHCSKSAILKPARSTAIIFLKLSYLLFHTCRVCLDNSLIKIDVQKNQTKLFSASQIILSFLNSNSGLSNKVILILTKLMSLLEKLYRQDPDIYCNISKGLSNWFKVNIMRVKRLRDNIKDTDWDNRMECPIILSDIFLALLSIESKEMELMLYRMVLTILDIHQVIKIIKQPNLGSINEIYRGEPNYFEQIDIERALKMLGIDKLVISKSLGIENKRENLHYSSASGPNGQALWMAHIDAKAVWSDEVLKENLKQFSSMVGRYDLYSKIEDCVTIPQFFRLAKHTPIHSKLHFKYEKGNKVRVLAMIDWWSQEFLNPTHIVIASILKGLDTDGTFDQDKIANKVKIFTSVSKQNCFSFDLTAATDRLPLTLQVKILNILACNDNYGKFWGKIICDRNFNIDGSDLITKYEVGQPMGAKSSFPMLGLTHHIIVMEAASRAGLSEFKDYVILGDDIFIGNSDVALRYKDIMVGLGLELSDYKSIVSVIKDSKRPIAEICKRIFVNGTEITPFPIKLAVTVFEDKFLAYQLQEVMFKRGLIRSDEDYKLFIINLIKDDKLASKQLALLNCLPRWATGMESKISLTNRGEYNIDRWPEFRGYNIEQFKQVFIYTVIVEQLKRLGTILANTEDTYTTIMKAASVTKTIGIGESMEQYLPIEDFSKDVAEDWELVNVYHPAIEVVKVECERVNDIIFQISAADDDNIMELLLSQVIDSLKISSFEPAEDKIIEQYKVTRKLLESSFKNMELLTKESRPKDFLIFSTKLKRLNIIWNISVSLDRNVTINRASGQIYTNKDKMVSVFNDFEKDL